MRIDIRYRRISASHIVLELKRGSRKLRKTEIEEQLVKYMDAVKVELNKDPKQAQLPIEGICLVGKLPHGWEDPHERKKNEDSLRSLQIRVMTYEELINNAESAYAKFLKASGEAEELNALLDRIRSYTHEDK